MSLTLVIALKIAKNQTMKLKRIVILALKGSKGVVPKLAEALDCSDQTIYNYLRDNDDTLTKAAALKVIREELDLTDEEILEQVDAKEARA